MVDLNRTPKAKRRIPPLVWIILAVVVAWIALSFVLRGGEDQTPEGGSMPQMAPDESYMPSAPARGDAPASPGREVVTPAPAAEP